MEKSREELFNDNNKLVHHVIHNKFQGLQTYIPGHEYEDIVQIGNIGLWKACKTFDFNKNIKFSTYAIKIITNEILMAIRKSNKNSVLNNSLSLNNIINDDGGETEFGDMLISNNPINDFIISDLKIYIYNKYKNSKKKINIITSYVFENLSQCEIGRKYGYSQAQISRILKEFKFYIKKDFGED